MINSNPIKFKKNTSLFYSELKKEIAELIDKNLMMKAQNEIVIKFVCYFIVYIFLYVCIYIPFVSSQLFLLILNYVLFGIAGILLAFNCAHDCIHNTFCKNKNINKTIFYLVFNLQGVNSRLWGKRHIFSHHLFPNVDGCDADIDDNPFIRLSPHHKLRKYQKYQHMYAFFLYLIYTLHWIFVKDFIYLKKKDLANLYNQTYTNTFVFELVVLKIIYFAVLILLPVFFTTATFLQILLAFFTMHFVISIFFCFNINYLTFMHGNGIP